MESALFYFHRGAMRAVGGYLLDLRPWICCSLISNIAWRGVALITSLAKAGAEALPRRTYLFNLHKSQIHPSSFMPARTLCFSVPVWLTGWLPRALGLPKCSSVFIIIVIVDVVVVFDWHLTSRLTSTATMKATSSLSLP